MLEMVKKLISRNAQYQSFGKQCIKYLGPKEREHYEYIVDEGKIVHQQTGRLMDTNQPSTEYKIGLKGEELGLPTGSFSRWISQATLPKKQLLIWYKVDLFFYKEPEEAKEQAEEEAPVAPEYGDFNSALGPISGDQWTSQIADGQWAPDAPASIPAVPGGGWTS